MPLRHRPILDKQMLRGHVWTPPAGIRPCLLCAMQMREPPDIRMRRITHGQWALDYPYTAGLEVRIGTPSTKWTPRPARVAHLYPPSLQYWERRSASLFVNFHEEAYLIFKDADALRPLIDRRLGYARFTDPDNALENLLAATTRIGAKAGKNGFWKAQSILCSVVDLLINSQRTDNNTWRIGGQDEKDSLSEFARIIDARLSERLGERLTLAEIARHAGVSASTLTHRYRAETGRTAMQALRNLRLTAAKGLLSKGWRLKEIAAQTGFVDAFHFSKTFKLVIGMSPRDFLQSMRGTPRQISSVGNTRPPAERPQPQISQKIN